MAAMECQPKNGSTRIITAAVSLKMNHKFFNEGTAKQACELFKVQAKQLSRVLMGWKYLGRDKKKTSQAGPKEQGKKGKLAKSHTTAAYMGIQHCKYPRNPHLGTLHILRNDLNQPLNLSVSIPSP